MCNTQYLLIHTIIHIVTIITYSSNPGLKVLRVALHRLTYLSPSSYPPSPSLAGCPGWSLQHFLCHPSSFSGTYHASWSCGHPLAPREPHPQIYPRVAGIDLWGVKQPTIFSLSMQDVASNRWRYLASSVLYLWCCQYCISLSSVDQHCLSVVPRPLASPAERPNHHHHHPARREPCWADSFVF